MNKILLTFLMAFFIIKGNSQSRFAVVKYNKQDVPGVIGEFPFVEGTTKDALINFFEKKGYKSKSTKGYIVFSSVVVNELGATPLDLYFMFDRKSRQEKDKALVTLLMSKGYESFVSDVSDSALISNAKMYLELLVQNVAQYDLGLQLAEQESVVKKANSKMNDLVSDSEKLAKRKREIEEDIVKNNSNQVAQKQDQEKQNQILNNLKEKLKIAATAKQAQ